MSDLQQIKANEKYCSTCGAIILKEAEICPKCGVRQIQKQAAAVPKERTCPSCKALLLKEAEMCPNCGIKLISVNNTLVWILAFIPAIVDLILPTTFFQGWGGSILALISNIFLCSLDERNIQKSGYDTAPLGIVWLVPVYLFKRAKYFNHNIGYFLVWCITFGFSILGLWGELRNLFLYS